METRQATFNVSHYVKVREARRAAGLPVCDLQEEVEHPLRGKKIRNLETGKVYNVEKTFKEFLMGWFYKALIECDKSHGIRFIENINCGDEAVLRQIAEFKEKFEVVEEKGPFRTYHFVTKFGDYLGQVSTPEGIEEAADSMAQMFLEHSGGYEIPSQVMVRIEENKIEIMRCLYSYLKNAPVDLTPLEASLLPLLRDYKEVQRFGGVKL